MPELAALGAQETTRNLIPQPSQILTVFTRNGNALDITLDGGATGSFIKQSCAVKNNFKIWPNNQSAGLADSKTCVKSIGYIEETFYRDSWAVKFKGLVVQNLKADIYGGQPFMIENDIIQRPAKKIITVLGKHTVMQTNTVLPSRNPNSAALVTLAKLNLKTSVLYPGQSITVQHPNNLPDGPICVDVRNNLHSSMSPTIQNNNEAITISNNSMEPVIIPNDINVVDITSCKSVNIQDIQTKPHKPVILPTKPDLSKIKIETSALTPNQLKQLNDAHSKYSDVFDGKLTGYNGYYGKHLVSLQWADESRPKSNRIHPPTWSSSKDQMLQKKIDQLTEMGVLTDPYQHNIQVKCVHPCFLQKKARAAGKDFDQCSLDELRFLTAPNTVNDKCRQVQTKVPDQNEIFKFLGNNKFVIFADLFESFFQNHLKKDDWGYVAINSPYKGLRVYTRSMQGLLNQDEELSQLLFKVLGDDIMKGHCLKIADDLIVGGHTPEQAINNWASVLEKLSLSNLKLSPHKVRCFPIETTIYGWSIQKGQMTPDPHRKLALSKTKHTDIKTVTDLRSWIGIYKTFLIAMPGIAQIMDPFDKLIAGVKEKDALIQWTPQLIQHFDDATKKISTSNQFLTLPKKEEQLILMPDATVRDPAVGFTLSVLRDNILLPVIYYSFKMNDTQHNWWPCEREALAVATAIKKCAHYILNSTKPTLILTDSKPVVEAFHLMKMGKFSTSSRMAAFLHTANQYRVDIQHVSGKHKQNIAPDYLSRNAASCPNQSCQLCTFIKETSSSVVAATSITPSNTGDFNINDYHKHGSLLLQSFGNSPPSAQTNANNLPLGTSKAWAQLQQEDFSCAEAFKRLKSGQQPNKKGPFSNDIRRYYNVCTAKDLLVVEETMPNTTQSRQRIVVPKDFVPAVIAQLHHREANHPSAYQLEKLFNRYYFGIHIKQVIADTLNTCSLCKANKHIKPYVKQFLPTSNPEHPGKIFNADVMRRSNQKVLVCRDIFSTYTTTSVIKTEQTQCLLNGILDCVTNIRSSGPIVIRTDSAPGFKALVSNPILERLLITIEPTDPANKNSVASVDNAIKELEEELVKLSPHESSVNPAILSMATKAMNTKIRGRGLTAAEILFSRDEHTQRNLDLQDSLLSDQQQDIKTANNYHAANTRFAKCQKQTDEINKGDTVALIQEKDKTKSRDIFLVTDSQKNNLHINKIMKYQTATPKLQMKTRVVPKNAVFHINQNTSKNLTAIPKYQPVEHPKLPTIDPWSPYTINQDSDSDDGYMEPIPPYNNHNDGNEMNDKHNHGHDPYLSLKQWEMNQIQHAKSDLHQSKSSQSPIQQEIWGLINDLDRSYQDLCSPNPDTTPPSFQDQTPPRDEIEWDHFQTPSQDLPPNPDMNLVQNVDELFEAAAQEMDHIDTNAVQNLERVLPLPDLPLQRKKKKRISPPRANLPLETGPKTRSRVKKC